MMRLSLFLDVKNVRSLASLALVQYSVAAHRPLVVAHDSRDVTRFIGVVIPAVLNFRVHSCSSRAMANLMGSFVNASVNNMQLAVHDNKLGANYQQAW